MHSVAKELGLTSSRFEGKHLGENADYYIKKAKKKDRSDLSKDDWRNIGYYKTDICEKLLKDCPDQVERIHHKKLSVEKFIENYESKNLPVVIQGLTENWKTEKYWTWEEVYERYKEDKFKVGEDDDGYAYRIKMKYFFEYLVKQRDDSPLYLFESALEDREEGSKIVKRFDVPEYFKEDLFSIMGEDNRPPFRWFLIGPERSGSTVHIDPLYTSAWNTSLQGHKRWILFPEDTPKDIVKGKQYLPRGEEYEAITYFSQIVPHIKKNNPNLKIIEFIQNPGETVFVPGGWWHAVLNVDNTMAVTQNFMDSVNFDVVWKSLRKERKKFSCKFLKKLQEKKPVLYQRALQLNKQDNFLMYDERKAVEKRHSEYNLEDDIDKKVKTESTNTSSSSSSSSSSSDSSRSPSKE